jgi:hypothetical protein
MARRTSAPSTRRPVLEGALRDAPTRRAAIHTLVYSSLASVVLVAAYFLLPLSHALTATTGATLGIGLILVLGAMVWDVRSIVTSPYPRVRAAAALITVLPLFLVVFAAAYFVMSRTTPDAFNEPLTRVDSAYFTITVFATVGFGDIHPVTETARIATSVQMLGGVVLVGVGARIILGAARRGASRTESAREGAASEQEDPL